MSPMSGKIRATAMGLAVAMLLAEVGLRLADPRVNIPRPPAPRAIDPYGPNPYIISRRPFIYFHIPGARYWQQRSNYKVLYEINSLGIRGPEIPAKTPGLKRLLVVGDSVIEGHGSAWEDTTAFQLNLRLRPHGWEVINAGVQGASPIYYAANLDRYLALEPDAVLLVLFDNDVMEDRKREAAYFDYPCLMDTTPLLAGHRHSSGLRALKTWSLATGLLKCLHGTEIERIIKNNSRQVLKDLEQKVLIKLGPNLVGPATFDDSWRMSERYLDYVAESLRTRNVPLFVANLAMKSLDPENPPVFAEHVSRIDAGARQWSERNHVPFMSLIPKVRAALQSHDIYELVIEDDHHPTKLGHALLAHSLGSWMQERLLGQLTAPLRPDALATP